MQGTTTRTKTDSRNPMPPMKTNDDDSGLHDLQALAKSTKKRRTQRLTSQMEAQDSLLVSGAALDAVVLPDPEKEQPVAVAAVATTESTKARTSGQSAKAVATAASATATSVSAAPSLHSEESKGGAGKWVAAVALIGAAALVFVLMKSGDKKSEETASTAAAKPAASAKAGLADEGAAPPPANNAEGTEGETAPALIPEGEKKELPSDELAQANSEEEGSEDSAATEDKAEELAAAEEKKEEAKPEKVVSAKKASKEEEPKSSSKKEKVATAEKSSGKKEKAAKTADKKKEEKKVAKASSGDSIDDILSGVTGGVEEKKGPAKAEEPAKKSLSRSDVSKAMKKVAKKARSCHAAEGFTGMVTVKYSVANDGSIQNATGTGPHKGSATGKCVAKVVKGARFPAYSGAKQSFSYPFMLSR